MDAFRMRINNSQQPVDISRPEFFKCAILENDIRYLVLLSDKRKRFIIDRVSCFYFLGNGNSEFLEKYHLYLFRGINIELFTDEIVYLEFFILRFPYDILADITEFLFVYIYSRPLHLSKNRNEFRFHVDDGLEFGIYNISSERFLIGEIRSLDRILSIIFRYLVVVLKVHKCRKIKISVDGRCKVLIVTNIEKRQDRFKIKG